MRSCGDAGGAILDPEERGSSSRGWRSCSGWASIRLATGRTCSLLGGCSSSVWPRATRRCSGFEDMQWADASLLDFVEYLLDWSRSSPIFVVTLARPELLERRPTWGAGQRNFTSLYLEPLPQVAMEELLTGLVPGLPPEVRDRILARAEGVPLYAVETVRMLLDRGLLVQEGPAYRLTGRGGGARGAGDAARIDRGAARRARPWRSGGCCRTGPCSGRRSRGSAGRARGI